MSQLVLGYVLSLELKLELISDKRNELTIRGLSLGIADGVAKESLQSIQIPPIPGDLDGVPDGPPECLPNQE